MKIAGNSRPLALCKVISVSRPPFSSSGVHVGHQAHRLQEELQAAAAGQLLPHLIAGAAQRPALLELRRHREQLPQVLDAAQGLDRPLRPQFGFVAGVVEHRLQGRPRPVLGSGAQTVEHGEKVPDLALGAPGQAGVVAGGQQGTVEPIPPASAARSRWPMVVWPIPRRGTLMMRFSATSSPGLTSTLR